jgi:pSer/pThr/pTyr-binding forkhead associated (FHA) protein/tetratricopeptide (TPR) repeat protein
MEKFNDSFNPSLSIGNQKIRVFLEEENRIQQNWVFSNYFYIGRNDDADVCVKDKSVSRLHAFVYFSKGKWWILDMSSLNGTIVDGKKIVKHPLESQTKLRLGLDGPTLKLSPGNNQNVKKLNEPFEDATHISSTKVRVVLVADGDDEQKEWSFTRHFSIGRHTGSDIRIKDESVSRFHSNVLFKEGKWWIQDMNSANGTFVNDKKISKQQLGLQTQLRLGINGPLLNMYLDRTKSLDVVSEQGDLKQNENHEYTIISERDYELEKHVDFPKEKEFTANRKATLKVEKKGQLNVTHIIQAQLKKQRKYLVVFTPIILIGLLLAGYGYLHENRGDHSDGRNNQAVKTATDNKNSNSDLTDSDKNAKKIAKVSTYKVSDQEIKTVENSTVDVLKEKNTIAQNQVSDIYFNAAKKFANNRYWEVAFEYYQNVLEINPDYPGLDMQIVKMKNEIHNLANYEQGVAHIKESRYKKGIERLTIIPENSVYYKEVSQRIEQAVKKQEQQDLVETQSVIDKKATAAISHALQLYADGKIKSSIKQLDHVLSGKSKANPDLKSRAKQLKAKVRQSNQLYYKGNSEFQKKQNHLAMSTWTQLLKADKKILRNKSGYFSRIVRKRMTDEYYSKAFKAHSEGDWPTAYQYSKNALNLDKKHTKSLRIKKMLIEKSKQLFQEGYILEEYNPEKAMEKWKKILKICAPDNEYYKKALRKINIR